MDTASLKRIRADYKKNYARRLLAIKQTDEWKEFIRCAGLQDFEFVVAEPRHLDPILKLAVETFNTYNTFPRLFGFTISQSDTPQF